MPPTQEKENKWNQRIRVFIDLLIFFAVFAIVILLSLDRLHIVRPFERGFYCNDQDLKYPYKEETISGTLLIVLAIFLLPVIMVIIEWFIVYRSDEICCKEGTCSDLITRLYKTIGKYLLGGTFTLLTVEIFKTSIGRLRPHFFEACRPNWEEINCTEDFIMQYNCTNEDEDVVISARKSFPSGHTAASCYEALYLVIYLQVRVYQGTKWARSVCPFVQTLAVGGAIFISISRLQDYHHHGTDVLGGAVIGICGCIITILFYSDLAKEYELPYQKEKPAENDDLEKVTSEQPPTYDRKSHKNGLKARKDKGRKKKKTTRAETGHDNEGYIESIYANVAKNKSTGQTDTPHDTEFGDNFESKGIEDEEIAPIKDSSDITKRPKTENEKNVKAGLKETLSFITAITKM